MVRKLVEAGHRFSEIPEYTLQQVLILSSAIGRGDAEKRVEFVTDMGLVVGSVLGGSQSLSEHLDLLSAAAEGEHENGNPG